MGSFDNMYEGTSDACYETNLDNICVMAWLATIVRGDGEG